MNAKEHKRRVLKKTRALNPRPEQVKASLFISHPFFDPEDNVQVKYEMLRAHQVENVSVSQVCSQFGFSRESYRHILHRFQQEGIEGLFGRKRGRKGPLKVTDQVRELIKTERESQRSLSAEELAERCRQRLRVAVSRRTVFRILAEEDESKKKPRHKGHA